MIFEETKKELDEEAIKQTLRLGIQPNIIFKPNPKDHDNNLDAFRHAYSAAKMVLAVRRGTRGLDYGLGVALSVSTKDMIDFTGLIYELSGSSHASSTMMDLHNNAVGADIGSRLPTDSTNDDIGDAIYQAMLKDELVVNVEDQRVYLFDYEAIFQKAFQVRDSF